MGVIDKMKFWKKDDDDLGDLGDFSDLGDFGVDNKSAEREQVQPSDQSQQLNDNLGLGSPADTTPSPNMDSMAAPPLGSTPRGLDSTGTPQQSAPQTATQPSPAPQASHPPQVAQPPMQSPSQLYSQNYDNSDIEKDMQIILARLDAIRSSIDNVNRRLDNLERMAGSKQRYQW